MVIQGDLSECGGVPTPMVLGQVDEEIGGAPSLGAVVAQRSGTPGGRHQGQHAETAVVDHFSHGEGTPTALAQQIERIGVDGVRSMFEEGGQPGEDGHCPPGVRQGMSPGITIEVAQQCVDKAFGSAVPACGHPDRPGPEPRSPQIKVEAVLRRRTAGAGVPRT